MLNRGSEWRRWEPHIHAPGTVMNNQFNGPSAWNDYLTALEQATPVIEAIAVTDYYMTDTYEEVLRHKAAGRLPRANLIFPNVELRLDVATAKGGFVNLHLFVSPDDAQHIEELRRLLSRLRFSVMQDHFDCTRADLIRLGKKADPKITDERAALSYGANQFKVNFQQLREVFAGSGWSKRFAQWLFSTDHISIRYGIDYDGVDIRKLSPGTRGIVLLLLYLALDDSDNRPLVIDQPEENLDPKSVFDAGAALHRC